MHFLCKIFADNDTNNDFESHLTCEFLYFENYSKITVKCSRSLVLPTGGNSFRLLMGEQSRPRRIKFLQNLSFQSNPGRLLPDLRFKVATH